MTRTSGTRPPRRTDPIARLNAALAGRYAIAQELGSGGMATVYLADDVKHHRQVAVKVLRPELAAALGPDRFLREIAIAAKLNHPHILALYDSGEADGFLFYVMPYIRANRCARSSNASSSCRFTTLSRSPGKSPRPSATLTPRM